MADYYSIIAKAVRALEPNTGEARRRLYDRARGALLGEMRSVELAMDQSDILTARMSLEAAITKVEAEVLHAEAVATAPDGGVQPAPVRRTMPNARQSAGTLSRLWTQIFGRGGNRAEIDTPRAGRDDAPRLPPAETPPGKGRDTWMTELLARASREEDEDDQAAAAPIKIRRIR
jgi:hypothetical protein